MKVIIPNSAIQAGMIVGSVVFVVVSELGDVVGLFVRKGAGVAGAAAGGLATVLAGPVAGVVTQETIRGATDGYFVPVMRTGGRVGALGTAAAAGLAAGLVVTLAHHGGQFIIRQIWGDGNKCPPEPFEFTAEDDADFSVICLPAVAATTVGAAPTSQTHGVGTLADNRGGVAADAADNISGALDGAAQEPQNVGASGHFYDGS
jgi:hypothetical protein